MNDAAEYNHAASIIKKRIFELLDRYESIPRGIASIFQPAEVKLGKNKLEAIFLNTMQNIIDNFSNFHIFVCSFTEEKDCCVSGGVIALMEMDIVLALMCHCYEKLLVRGNMN